MEQLRAWYEGLDEREQKIVTIAAIFFALFILFFGLIKPMNDKVSKLEKSVSGKQRTINEWQVSLPKLIAHRGQVAPPGGQNLSSIVTSSTRRFNLRVSRVQEKGPGEIQVWFDNVPFNDFVKWVVELNNKHQVSVASVNIRSKDKNGLSSIDVKLAKD